MANHEFSFADDELTRNYSNLDPICRSTFMKYFHILIPKVESSIATELPAKFAIVHDGWSHNGTHYIGIFAAYSLSPGDDCYKPLIAMSPLLDEETRRERLKSAPHLRLKKRKRFFLEKK